MKSLTLFRHAKTDRDSETGRDFDRRLTDQGRDDARRIGEEIGELGLEFGLILSSPASRAAETAELAHLTPRFDPRIYNASPGDLLDIVREADDAIDRLILIGHNPGFERLAARLAGQELAMPPGALAEIDLPIESWRDIEAGRLARLLKPKELD